ncbi:MAG: GIY-YIG nuclease family protein [Cytophagaceae bacterium]|nr:GIY-YIG nuclease family protein [Cytophagaceae bacterium]
MSHYVYILYSVSIDKYYTGESHNPALRLKLHNAGATKSTKSGIPWVLVYTELHPDRTNALKREKEIKRRKSRKYILELIEKLV